MTDIFVGHENKRSHHLRDDPLKKNNLGENNSQESVIKHSSISHNKMGSLERHRNAVLPDSPGEERSIDTHIQKRELWGTLAASLIKLQNHLEKKPTADAFCERKQQTNLLVNTLAVLPDTPLDEHESQLLSGALADIEQTIQGVLFNQALTGRSDKDICEQLIIYISVLGTDYLDIYENAVSQMTDYWSSFTDEIQAKLAEWTKASGSTDIEFDIEEYRKALQEIIDDAKNHKIYPTPEMKQDNVSKKDAQAWASALGLPDSCVIESPAGSGTYIVVVDTTPLQTLLDNAPKSEKEEKTIKMSSVTYQAWLTSFNAQVENFKTNCQTITTKYSTANSLYDTTIKLLTSTITSLFDSLKDYLKF